MSLFAVAVLGVFFALLYVTALAGEIPIRESCQLDADAPAIKPAARLGFRARGPFQTGGIRRAATSCPPGVQHRPAETSQLEKLRRAAAQGGAQAQFDLGLCYEGGCGVARNMVEAMKWFRAAADQGYREAQYTLGCCYHGDGGTPKDYNEGIKWWAKAAGQGHADAQYCLGLAYYMGQGVAKNPDEAKNWWARAAEQDQANAQYFLGLVHYTGLGVPKHAKLARYWLRRAASHGNENARIALQKLGEDTEFPRAT